jgi:hypothetical protein
MVFSKVLISYADCKRLQKKRKASQRYDSDCCSDDDLGAFDGNESMLSEDLQRVIMAKRYAGMPKDTLFFGLFQGAVPAELQELTMVEHSMISIYSNLTRIAMQAGVHYHAKPTVYTVVNDLTSVMKQLPNFASINSFAILRHRSSQRVKHY